MQLQNGISNLSRRTAPWGLIRRLIAAISSHRFERYSTSYRPERHYMRGPGPRWREKHGRSAN